MAPSLPPTVRVLVRGWLNCNSIVLRAPGDNVLVDSGYCTHREQTLERVAGPGGLEAEPLERLINTHCHSDHMGGNAAIASAYGCRVTIPEGEVKHVDPWTPQSVWMAQFDQRADPFHFDDTLAAGDSFAGGELEWEVHAAPGHDMDALMFFQPRHGILVSGDALWEDGMGFVWPEHGPNPYIDAAHEALSAIEALNPAVVIPGHGRVFADPGGAVKRARSRLDAFARDPVKNARHVVKVMFVFALLDRGSMRVEELPGYLERIPCYARMAEQFIGQPPRGMAGWVLDDLQRAGAVAVVDGWMRPTMAA
jgi:glyoxylase-like metal-dependent hydrolase (beta-lactamase superfamily II)